MIKVSFNVSAEDNSYCKRIKLRHTTDVIIPIINEYLSDKDFNDYSRIEFYNFLDSLRLELPF